MTDAEIDALVYAALSSNAGAKLHAWLNNNYVQADAPTLDTNAIFLEKGQRQLVIGLNSRYARHLERQNAARTETGHTERTGARSTRRARRET